MLKDKARAFYILSLLILTSLLVLFAQGVFSGLLTGASEPVVEISRIELYDNVIGNYSKISIFIRNNDSINHNFSINTFYDENLRYNYNTTVDALSTFSYGMDMLPDKILISNHKTINSTLQVAKIVVYMDDKPEPFEEASFVFKNTSNYGSKN